MGFPVSESSIKITKAALHIGCIATVSLQDAKTGKLILEKFEKELGSAQKGIL